MEDLFKKALYTGVGLVATTTEKIQKSIDDLVKKGKISEDEGKKVVEDVEKNIETKREEFDSKLKDVINSTLEKLNLTKGEDSDTINKLEKRIKSLEVKLGLISKELDALKKSKKETASK